MPTTTGIYATATGMNSITTGNQPTAIGMNSITTGNQPTAIGMNSTSIGNKPTTTGIYPKKIGRKPNAVGTNSVTTETAVAINASNNAIGTNFVFKSPTLWLFIITSPFLLSILWSVTQTTMCYLVNSRQAIRHACGIYVKHAGRLV